MSKFEKEIRNRQFGHMMSDNRLEDFTGYFKEKKSR